VEGQFALIDFNFTLFKERDNLPGAEVERVRAEA
jgi:catechol 1,2-dioxygenase